MAPWPLLQASCGPVLPALRHRRVASVSVGKWAGGISGKSWCVLKGPRLAEGQGLEQRGVLGAEVWFTLGTCWQAGGPGQPVSCAPGDFST